MDWVQSVGLYIFYLFISVCESQGYYETNSNYGLDTDTVILEKSPGDQYSQFPETYAIWFEHQGEPFFYELVKDGKTTLSLNPSIFKLCSFLPDDLMTDDNEQDFAYYHNSEPADSPNRADFVLHRRSVDDNGNFYGRFIKNSETYLLQHVEHDTHRVRRSGSDTKKRNTKDLPVPGTTSILEVFVWSGPDVFKFHRRRLGVSARNVEDFLRTWEKAIIRDADLIFRAINSTDIRLYYMGGGNDRDTSISWYADNIEGTSMRRQALDNVTTYLSNLVQRDIIPRYDTAVVLTRQDLSDDYVNAKDKIAYGPAALSVCNYPPGVSVSLAEVSSPFFVKAVAQSIMFAFGVDYNSAAPYTVMSRSVDTNVPFENRRDRWTLDRQSQNRMRRAIDALLFDCLKVENVQTDYMLFLSTPTYGATYKTIREQCEIFAGANSRTCRRMDRVCYDGVMCLDSSGDCTLDYFTGDRIPCGTGTNSCRYGDCAFQEITTSTAAPTSAGTTAAPTSAGTTAAADSTSGSTSAVSSTTTSPRQQTTSPVDNPLDCCCERRPLGKVVIEMEYVPTDGCSNNRARYFYP